MWLCILLHALGAHNQMHNLEIRASSLNGVAVVYDWDIDAGGAASWELCEWK